MKLHCKVVSGYQAGLDKELDRDTVLISRDAKADIQLHPTKDLQVGSQRHVELVRDGDGYIVRCQHANGVTLISNGEETQLGHGQQGRFTGEADLVLGKDGPRVRCIAIDAAVPATVTHMATMERARMPVSEVSSGTVQKAEESSGKILKVGAVCVALALLVGVGSFFAFQSAGNRADDKIDELTEDLEDQAEEREEDLAALNRAMDASVAEMTTMRAAIVEIDAEVRRDFAAVLREHTKSVASVGIVDREGLFTPGGTAWVVEDRLLATNAHVVKGLREMYNGLGGEGAGIRAVARFSGAVSRDVEIDMSAIKSHPGYAYFFEVLASHTVDPRTGSLARYTPGGGVDFFQVGNAYDVGLLPTTQDAGTPLRLAKEADLRELAQGTEIAYIGYPSEGLVGPRINTPADLHIGRLTSMTNFASEADTFETSLILTHSLPTVGGSSGSPIFSKDGLVIGLISHGSIMQIDDSSGNQTRIGLGFNYGQRVTMLREILAGAEQKDARRLREQEVQRQFAALNMVDDVDRANVRSLFMAKNLLKILQDLGMADSSLSLNLGARETGFDTWPPADQMRVLTIPIKPGKYVVSCATGGVLDIVLLVKGPNNQEFRSDDTGELSAEAVYFTVPGNPGVAAVDYEFMVARFDETIETPQELAVNIFPLE